MAEGNFGDLDLVQVEQERKAAPARTLLQIVPDFEKIEGWLTIEDSMFLFAAAASIRSGCIVEVGSFRGRSTVALCAGSIAGDKIPVYAIEPHEHFIGMKGGVFGPSDRRAFFKTMLTTRLASVVRLINATSRVVTPGWDKPVSLLFIDGDHRYEAVLTDFFAWRQHLVDQALVIFNDLSGSGTALVVKDLMKDGVLSLVQKVGRLGMFSFHAVSGEVDPELIEQTGLEPVYPAVAELVAGAPSSAILSKSTYYSRKFDYLYRAIAKCGCSTVKTALIELEGLPLDTNPTKRHSKELNKFPGTDALTAQQEADLFTGKTGTFKFVIVRDPYSRLASAYADKITAGYERRGDFWIDQIKTSAAAQGIHLSDKITFDEFVRVVSGQSVQEMDIHWRPQYDVARFDLIKFDFVGRTELISTDFAYILERIGAPAAIMHKAIQPHNATGSSLAMWSMVSAETRTLFLRTFAADFDTLCYPRRFSSVLFSPVNVDRPKPFVFTKTDRKARIAGDEPSKRQRAVQADKPLVAAPFEDEAPLS
jgi:predicted O-methyltransferase YrrM